MNYRKIILSGFATITIFLASSLPSFAHVIVTPSTAGVASNQTFKVSTPNEKDVATTGLRLVVPDGVKNVMPNVKSGWNIEVTKNEINWTGGLIPPGQRDDFYFTAQVPSKATVLKWKAYQTYEDGSVVEWTHDPTKNPEDENAPPPYSTTEIVNDLAPTPETDNSAPAVPNNLTLLISLVALGLSVTTYISSRKK